MIEDQEQLREMDVILSQQFADTGYIPLMAKMFPQSQVLQLSPGIQTHVTYALTDDQPIVATGSDAGAMLGVFGREVKIEVFEIKNSLAPDYKDYSSKKNSGMWAILLPSLLEQATTGMYRAMDATIIGGDADKQLVEARKNKIFRGTGFFDDDQKGVYKFPFALPAGTYAVAVRSISMVHDRVRFSNGGVQLRVNRIAIDEKLYSMLQELTDPGTGITVIDKILKKYPEAQFIPILGFGGVMAYDDMSPFHKIAVGSYPAVESMGESRNEDGSKYYRVHLEAQFGGNVFGRDEVFAAAKLDLGLENLTNEQLGALK